MRVRDEDGVNLGVLQKVGDRRGVTAAQLLQAGLLPNPQLTAGIDLPRAADPGDRTTAYNLGLNWDITALITLVRRDQRGIAVPTEVDFPFSASRFRRLRSVRMSDAC